MSQSIVEIHDLNHYFGQGDLRSQILFNINLTIHPGEFVIMTGPSGSGKSTLLSLIGCLRIVQEGSLKILGQEIKGLTEQQRTQVRYHFGYIFQASNLLKFLTAEQNIHMSLELNPGLSRSEVRERTHTILDTVGLRPQAHNYPHQLSGGQKQRIGIACALVNRPALVLADEPTAALDSRSGRRTVELMHRLAKERNSAVLMVTHDQRILDVADRIIQVEDGCLGLGYRQELTLALPGLKEDSLETMAVKPTVVTYEPEAYIFYEGEFADKFYVVIQGQVDVMQSSGKDQVRVLNTIGRGGYFGEIGLLQGSNRTASVRVTSDSAAKLMVIERDTFLTLMEKSQLTSIAIAEKMQSRLKMTRLSEALPSIDIHQIMQVLPQVEMIKYGAGSNIMVQGEPANNFYILMSGQVEIVSRDANNNQEILLNTLRSGDYFGEIGLMEDRPRTATARVSSQGNVEVIVLNKETFCKLIETSNASQMELANTIYERLKHVV